MFKTNVKQKNVYKKIHCSAFKDINKTVLCYQYCENIVDSAKSVVQKKTKLNKKLIRDYKFYYYLTNIYLQGEINWLRAQPSGLLEFIH